MLNNVWIDVGIGLMFVYLTFSVVVTAATEIVECFRQFRTKQLRKAIELILEDDTIKKDLVADFYNHPLIKRLTRSDKDPSYIDRTTFVAVLQDVLLDAIASNDRPAPGDIDALIAKLPEDSELKKALGTLVTDARMRGAEATAAIEGWFDQAMDRCTGVFKRYQQWISLAAAAVVVVALNVDTIRIAETLSADPALRNAVVKQAVSAVEAGKLPGEVCTLAPAEAGDRKPDAGASDDDVKATLDRIACNRRVIDTAVAQFADFPIGWTGATFGVLTPVGWVITALALWLGAPFWFDMLSRFVRLRSSGPPPETKS